MGGRAPITTRRLCWSMGYSGHVYSADSGT
jgi:hypothetical protein